MRHRKYPLLEYDSSLPALIEPQAVVHSIDAPEHCVICFFREVTNKLVDDHKAKIIAAHNWEDMDRPLYEINLNGKRLAVIQSGVGGPLAAALLEEVIARGCRKFIACGGCGVLDRELTVGHLIVPVSAVRDEGTSYHYLPPGREVSASSVAVTAIEAVLQKHNIKYVLAKTWTTDAPYRETPAKINLRKEEGCLTVEMEAAAFFAVAQFRGIPFGQILYAGDDISGNEWDQRDWHDRRSVRENLFWLAAEACLNL